MFITNSITSVFLFQEAYRRMHVFYPDMNIRTLQLLSSTFHALYTSILSILFISDVVSKQYYIHLLAFSMGFTIFDIYKIIEMKNKIWKQMLGHHIILILGLSPILFTELTTYSMFPNYTYYLSFAYLTEISTIPLNICWYYNENNKKDSLVFKTASILTLISYFIYRIVLGIYLTFSMYYYETGIHPLPELQLTLLSLNCYWFYKLYDKVKPLLFVSSLAVYSDKSE